MGTIGEKLRRQRLHLNLELPQVAARIKISVAILEAIEGERWDLIPGKFFAKSFVRQYASALGIEDAEIDPALDSLFQTDDVKPFFESGLSKEKIHLPPIATESARPGSNGRRVLLAFLALVAVVLACSGVYALWQDARHRAPAPPPAAVEPVAPRKTVEPAQPAEAPKPETAAQTPSASQETAVPQAPPAGPVVIPRGRLVVSLTATEKTWLSLSVDGKRVFEGILEPGESKAFGGEDSAVLHVGNAGGLEIQVNGKPIGSIGRSGQVRVIDITPEG